MACSPEVTPDGSATRFKACGRFIQTFPDRIVTSTAARLTYSAPAEAITRLCRWVPRTQ